MKSLYTWRLISESLKHGLAVMLLYVLDSNGSSPGRAGFFMAVNASGEMEGSLGGGIMEHKFIEMAKTMLRNDMPALSVHQQIHNKTAPTHQSGMICSGEQTIFLYRIPEKDAGHINSIIHCLELNNNGILQLSPAGIEFSAASLVPNDIAFTMRTAEDWIYHERIGFKNHLYIIGGGHCSLALSHIMSLMDFYIHLFDDRKGLKTMHQNEFAHEKEMLDDYSSLAQRISSGANHYVVIMTVGYRTDAMALQALINKDFKYLGLLGSSYKIGQMFEGLRSMNIDEALIQRIHAPVGLAIKSHTPEEVAVSIAAEIIKVKNQGE